MGKNNVGIVGIIAGVLLWCFSFSFGQCFIDSGGRKLCTGAAALRDFWFVYWIVAVIFILFGIVIIMAKKENKNK